MKVTVIGSGYVGLVAGACLAETGNEVVCADVDAKKIDGLRNGILPIYEPGLDALVVRNAAEGRLRFTTEIGEAVRHGDIVFIAVGTPPGEDGSADLQHVLAVATTIGNHCDRFKVVVTKSTVPVGTAEKVRGALTATGAKDFAVASNPEFLKEGAAIDDFMKPDRVVLGTDDPRAEEMLRELYAPFVRSGAPILFMDIPSAEVTKYAANAMLATRISFMNQIADLCERVGADVFAVRNGIGSDSRIGKAFLFPGPGYGGSCFPKDVKALVHTARSVGMAPELLEAVESVNARQKQVMFTKLQALLGDVRGTTVAVWGLAFKAGTDDMRESPASALIDALLDAGANVRAHDPEAMTVARGIWGDRVTFAGDPWEALEGADALAVVTEWLVYRTPDFDRIKAALRRPILVDGRNLYEPARMARLGFQYAGIGRRTS
ncbi:MAG: UDP-glucose/GDP-mannose dehydrogenase family protein [Gemmatimonadales bacterium]|nr:UDP-glucose/GDP-mannose dehydrogenase family protein [Gemmatimonadales bacterium]MBP6572644.1 UDP-glucose/GDP-mannose dehydrogenase family protein [Gemmatimonadales bacterium]MBP7621706.1 UDP-glucose/GDP-mannose dehydrogenase family protein [Gemmatimonadales bacterium]MBP9897413.1 UDP-glucose/GDP-mannose dehydrogenase family protein [Gemmatimonadales bacterium]